MIATHGLRASLLGAIALFTVAACGEPSRPADAPAESGAAAVAPQEPAPAQPAEGGAQASEPELPPLVLPDPLPAEPEGNASVEPERIPAEAVLWRVDGDTDGDWFGMGLTGLGDVDGDGVPDFAAGAAQNYNWGHGEPGYVHVVSGGTGETLYTLHPSGSLQVDGRDDHFGTMLSSLGDVDGDGARELVVGAYLYDSTDENTGGTFVFSGATGELLHLMAGEAWGDRHGWALSPIADMDGDGREDLLMGVEKTDQGEMNSGSIQVFSSATFERVLRVEGPGEEAHLGCSITPLGDVDGDGVPDFAGGAFMIDSKAPDERLRQRGGAAAYSGRTGALLHLWLGSAAKDHLGNSIAALGAVGADAADRVAAGAFQSGYVSDYTGPGYVRVYSLADGSGVVELRGRQVGEQFGWCVANAGDRDGDGRDDLLVGAPASITVSEQMLNRPGRLYLYSGADFRLLRVIDGLEPDDQLGVNLAVIGDLDGDGLDELLVGAVENVYGQTRPGYVAVLRGSFLDCRAAAPR
jgi:hypothetical protein